MLPRESRLTKKADIDRVFKKGKGIFDSVAGIKFAPNELGVTRITVVVGTKVSKSAVKRNRVKRQLRAAIGEVYKNIKPGFDIMVLTSPKSLEADFETKQQHVNRVLKKSGLL